MEVLRDLQASLAHTLGKEFEQAEERLDALLTKREERNNEIQRARQEERDRQYSALNQDYELRGAKIKELQDQLKDLDKWQERALEAETLREDNAELQRELEALKPGAKHTPENNVDGDLVKSLDVDRPDLVIQDFTAERGDSDTIPYASYTELARRYQELFRKSRQLAKALSKLKTKHRGCKKVVKDWNQLLEKETFTTTVNGKRIIFRQVGNNEERGLREERPDSPATVNGQETIAKDRFEEPAAPKTLATQLPQAENGSGKFHDNPQPSQPSLPALTTAIVRSPPIKTELEENDNDEVQEIANSTPASTLEVDNDHAATDEFGGDTSNTSRASALNSLKRKRHQRQNEEVQTPNSSDSSRKLVTIKSEQTSSSPLQNLVQHHELNNLDTQDLDEIDKSVQTPKRDKAGPAANIQKLPFSILQDGGSSESTHRTHSGHQHGNPRQNAAVLQPRNCNQNIVRRLDGEDPGHDAKRRRGDRGVAKAIPIITEDGEDDFYVGRGKGQGAPRKSRESARLNDLLEAGSSPKKELTPRPHLQSAGAKLFSHSTRDPNNQGQPSLVTPSRPPLNKTAVSARQAPSTGTFTSDFKKPGNRWVSGDSTRFNHDTARTSSHDEPYRSRPVDRLSLENFKINPERNEGIDYAFDDVVRKRDQRQCLPGCTRPDCCGSGFRAMAKLGGLNALPGRASADEDTEILENYLGDQKQELKTMNEDERRELLIDAKAEALAARYGRHRYAHERHHSPPGFWRTDMPSTQELEQDREEARRMEREKVANRYREAMRPGGMWKFADE